MLKSRGLFVVSQLVRNPRAKHHGISRHLSGNWRACRKVGGSKTTKQERSNAGATTEAPESMHVVIKAA